MQKSATCIFILILIFQSNVAAEDKLATCNEENDIKSISVPLYFDKPVGIKIQYLYRYLRGSNPEMPVVIYLPGGPGQDSINTGDPRHKSSYGFIQTDPRGTGCNTHNNFIPDDAINTDNLASDIVTLITQLKLKKYIIYGVSYGSILATKVSYEIEKKGMTPPLAIVLEGVVGRAVDTTEVEYEYSKHWNSIKLKLDNYILKELSTTPLPFNIKPQQWALYLKFMMMVGRLPNSKFSLESQLSLLNGSQIERDQLRLSIESIEGPTEDEYRVYKLIACHELYNEDHGTVLLDGDLKKDLLLGDSCKSIPFNRPIDTANWPVQTQIYYFVGENDPAAPLTGAYYHFNNQPISKKIFILVKEAGHNPLKVNLSDCAPILWEAILRLDVDLKKSLEQCSLSSSFTVK